MRNSSPILPIAVFLAAFGIGTASAADLPLKAPAMKAEPAINWTGFYLGAGGGYGLWGAEEYSVVQGVQARATVGSSGRGWFGTVTAGYDWQFSRSWVAGVFADAQWGTMAGSLQELNEESSLHFNEARNYAGGVRAGYLIAPNVLSYLSAGYSRARFEGVGPVSRESTEFISNAELDGWFVGGGVENSLDMFGIAAPGWFMKTEYRVTDYSRKYVPYLPVTGGVGLSFNPTVQTATTQIVYRFNTPGTAPAAPLYTKAPKTIPVNWTGFYLSGGGGYGMFDADVASIYNGAPTVDGYYHGGGKGYIGTVGGGYDWQFARSWVGGLFADAQFGSIKGIVNHLDENFDGVVKNNLNVAVGARLGFLVAPNVLSYVNGGYSHADFKGITFLDSNGGLPDGYTTAGFRRDGYFLGSGVENTLDIFGISAPGWFMKSEYRLAEYRRGIEVPLDSGVPFTNEFLSLKPYVQTITTQLVYRFNASNSVVAKY